MNVVPLAQEERNLESMMSTKHGPTDAQEGERPEPRRRSAPARSVVHPIPQPLVMEPPAPMSTAPPTLLEPPAHLAAPLAAVQPLPLRDINALPALASRWTDQEYLVEGMYIFRAWAGPGIRLYLDGELILDGLEPYASYEVTYGIAGGGVHNIVVEVYVTNSGTPVRFAWEWLG